MLGESCDISKDETSVYRNKISIPLNNTNNEVLNFSTEKRAKFIKKDKCPKDDIPSSKKDE